MKRIFIKFIGFCLIVTELSGCNQSQKKEVPNIAGNDTVTSWIVTDPYYPKYHVAPPYGWMDDPHPIYFKGAFHLFYQFSCIRNYPFFNPPGQKMTRYWGHAMSVDLVHWKHKPVALKPFIHSSANDPTIYSGCIVDNNGVGTAIYTINNIDIWISTSNDNDLSAFTKYPNNPVIKGPPSGLEPVDGMRDPWAWKEGDSWYMIIGSGFKGGKGPVLPLYKSSDLIHWDYLHPLYRGDSSKFDFIGDADFCEDPSFFPLGNKYVLVLSDKSTYLVGRYENHWFIPEQRGRLDYGKSPNLKEGGIYVPRFALDNKGRRIMWGWVGGWERLKRERQMDLEAGWGGLQTLPRVLTLNSDCLLNFEPAEELILLRSDHKEFSGISLAADRSIVLDDVQGLQLEIHAIFEPGTSKNFGIEFLDALENAKVFYDVQTQSLCFNQILIPLELNRKDNLDLRVFIDAKVVEIYANKKIVLTENLKPSSIKGYRIKMFSQGGNTEIIKVDVWKMGTIW